MLSRLTSDGIKGLPFDTNGGYTVALCNSMQKQKQKEITFTPINH